MSIISWSSDRKFRRLRLSVGPVEPASASHSVLPRLIRRLRERHPEIELDVRELITPEQVDALADRRIDLGLARPPLREAGLVERMGKARATRYLLTMEGRERLQV